MLFETFLELLTYYESTAPDAPALIYEAEKQPADLSVCAAVRQKDARSDSRTFPAGTGVLTYAGLKCEVLTRMKRFRDSRAAAFLIGDSTKDTVIDIFAAVSAGARVILLDENVPEEVLGRLIRLTEADTVIGDRELTEALTPYLCRPKADGKGEMLFFTSGTTNRSKAVTLTERSLLRSAYNGGALLPLDPEDRLLLMLPLNHVFGFVCGLLWGLNCGAAVAVGRGIRHYADDCLFFRPTAVSLVPLLLGFCLKKRALNPELKLLLVGAGDCPPEYLEAAKSSGIRVSFGYGLTETSSGIALSLGDDPYKFTICPDFDVSIAEDGEILVKSPETVMKGYFKRPEDTRAVLVDSVLHTGDLGSIDSDGFLTVTGRKKEMIVLTDGTKIFLPEYEAALIRASGEPDLAVELKDNVLTLVISEKAGTEEEIIEKIRRVTEQYPRGQQIRKIIRTGAPLPRTATGKLKRYEIAKIGDEDQ